MRDALVTVGSLLLFACSLGIGEGLTGGDTPAHGPDATDDGGILLHVDDAASNAQADAAPHALRFRGMSTTKITNGASSFVFEKPPGTQAGDLLWVVVAGGGTPTITPPSEFVIVTGDTNPSCAPDQWTLTIYSHVATETDPTSYSFAISGSAYNYSAVILALEGVAPSGARPASDGLREIKANPFALPTVPAPPEETYALATITGRTEATWASPANATLLTAATNIVVFGRSAPASQPFDFGTSTATPDNCGHAHVALLRVR